MADNEVIASLRTSLDEDMSKVMAFGLVRKEHCVQCPQLRAP